MPEPSSTTGAVFISYASQDADAAARIRDILRSSGIDVWIDQSELRGGDAWDAKIRKQIHDCALFIPVISAHTNARAEGYFRGEWNLATRRLLNMAQDAPFLLPVVIDNTREAEARVPEEFLRAQWTRLPDGMATPAFTMRVRQLLGHTAAGEFTWTSTDKSALGPSGGTMVGHSPPAMSHKRRLGIALTAVLIAAAGGVLWTAGGVLSYVSNEIAAPDTGPASARTASDTAAKPHDKSIAVLPFVDMSAEKDQGYMSDGIAEELLNVLAQVPELKVIARTSSFAFKGQDIDIATIANKLNVAHILEGSLRKSGDKLRITAQLVRASDSTHLWSRTYDRQLTDVFEIQDQIAASVVEELKARLIGEAPTSKTTDPKAYALFLQGRAIGRQNTRDGYEQSNALYQQVLALDPAYLAAWEALARNYLNQAFVAVAQVGESTRLAREATTKALELAPARAATHLSLANIAAYYDLDFSEAAKHLEDALALEPKNPDVLLEAGALMRRLLRLDEAIAIGRYQVSLDPINPVGFEVLGSAYFYVGRVDDALAAWRTILNLSPDSAGGHELYGEGLLAKGDFNAALTEMQQELLPGNRHVGLSMAYHALGRKTESDAALARAIQDHSKEIPFMIAYAHAYRGDADQAFAWLENAAKHHDFYFVAVAGHPMLRNIHSDPRWLPFLRKHGMAPEQLAAVEFNVEVPE